MTQPPRHAKTPTHTRTLPKPSRATPTPFRRPRALMLTLCVTAVTVTGVWYGAGLKETHQRESGQQDSHQQSSRKEEQVQPRAMDTSANADVASKAARIAALETRRARLEGQRLDVENKIGRLRTRIDARTAGGE